MDRIFYAKFTASKTGKTGLTVAGMVKRWIVTRSTGAWAAQADGDSVEGGLGLYSYRWASINPTLYDYVCVFVTTDATVDDQQPPSLWSEFSPRAELALPNAASPVVVGTSPGFPAWAQGTAYVAGQVIDRGTNDLYQAGTTHTSTTIGAWDSGTPYDTNDVVSHSGNYWYALQPSTNQEPTGISSYWSGPSTAFDAESGAHSGRWSALASGVSVIELAATGSYVGRPITIYAGTNIGEVSRIVSVAGTTATVRPAFTAAPDNTSAYQIWPVIVPALSAAGAAVAVVNTADTAIVNPDNSSITTILSRTDVATSTRMATFTYTTPPTAAAIADAVCDEAAADHKAAGSFGAIWNTISDIPTVSEISDAVRILPLSVSITQSRYTTTAGAIINLDMAQNEEGEWAFAIVDENGDAVPMTGHTIQFNTHYVGNTVVFKCDTSSDGVTIADNVITVVVSTTKSATARTLEYKLWDLTDHKLLASGQLDIKYAPVYVAPTP